MYSKQYFCGIYNSIILLTLVQLPPSPQWEVTYYMICGMEMEIGNMESMLSNIYVFVSVFCN